MKVTDPVCGVEIDAEKAVAVLEFDGQLQHFCSLECRRLFEAHPDHYVRRVDKAQRISPSPEKGSTVSKGDDHD